jgi:hypothetical protein
MRNHNSEKKEIKNTWPYFTSKKLFFPEDRELEKIL